jgi:amidophosphoribosyltransferase
MCGIVGIVDQLPVNQLLYDALLVLQHRGQDAAGMVTCEGPKLHLRKDRGLARDVFHTRHMLQLKGHYGIAHVRYPTAGLSSSSAEAQPFYVNSPYGIALAHNGNLTNAEQLRKEIFHSDLRHINTESDSEILLNILAHELQTLGKLEPDQQDFFKAVSGVHQRCRGGYAAVALIAGFGILAFRDPFGIRPLVFGCRETEQGVSHMVASESVALDALGYQLVRDVAPGEAIFIDESGQVSTAQCAVETLLSPCMFEYVYFARPDSIIDNISVHKARSRMGTRLARKIARDWAGLEIDRVIPIPDTSRTVALQVAKKLSVRYAEGFIKNRYIARTFIMPGQKIRKKSVRQKLNAIDLEFRGKNVLLVDDSIVRGTTSKQIVQMARDAGANKVYFASASPPVRYPNVYGIDMPATSELVASGRSPEEVGQLIGCDGLIYQDLADLVEAVKKKGKSSVEEFDTSVFSGNYVTADIGQDYLQALEKRRNDAAKAAKESSESIIGIYNQD